MNLVRPLSTVENTPYARVFHSRQWSNYKIYPNSPPVRDRATVRRLGAAQNI